MPDRTAVAVVFEVLRGEFLGEGLTARGGRRQRANLGEALLTTCSRAMARMKPP